MPPLRAAIYDLDRGRSQLAATALAEAHHWAITALVWTWPEVLALACSGQLDLAIVGSRSLLDPDRVPRIVAVDEHIPPPTPPGQPRPRWLP